MAKHKITWFIFPLMISSVYLAAAHMDDDAMDTRPDATGMDPDAMEGTLPQHTTAADTPSAPPLSGGYNSGTRTAFYDETAADNDIVMDLEPSQHPIVLPPTPDADNLAQAHPVVLPPTPPVVLPPTPDETESISSQSAQNYVEAQLPSNAPLILSQDFDQAERRRVKAKRTTPTMDPMNLSPSQIVFQLPPLALHLVNFVTAPPSQVMGTSITQLQYKVAQALATPGVAGLVQQLQLLGMVIELLRACNDTNEAPAQIAPTTTADAPMSNNVTIVDAPDVASVTQRTNIENLWNAITQLRQTMSNQEIERALSNLVSQLKATMTQDQFRNLSHDEHYLQQALTRFFINFLNGILPDNIPSYLAYLEKIQVHLLTCIDDRLLPPPPKNYIRCLTWLVSPKPNGEEFVHPPYATMIYPQEENSQPTHIMFYNHLGPYVAGQSMTLKVVVENYLCEVPFVVQIPPHLLSVSVVVVARPKIRFDGQGNPAVSGVKVVLYEYTHHHILQQPAQWAFKLN